MPLYELAMIARRTANANTLSKANQQAPLKELLTTTAKFVLDSKGVVRQFTNAGLKELPYRMRRHQEIFAEGIYLTMKFDASPRVMRRLSKAMALNETVIRHTMLNLGTSLSEVSEYSPPERIRSRVDI